MLPTSAGSSPVDARNPVNLFTLASTLLVLTGGEPLTLTVVVSTVLSMVTDIHCLLGTNAPTVPMSTQAVPFQERTVIPLFGAKCSWKAVTSAPDLSVPRTSQ